MLTYRGDKFVKGKKFKINENMYRFSKRDDNKLIFESVSDGSKFTITEEEFNEAERILTEKINQENKEVNEIIGKVLRSKGLARKYEDMLKEKGIKVDYDQGQGVTLIGPNGKVLDASSKYIGGPSKPGQRGTHSQGSNYYKRDLKDARERLDNLKSMDRDDIIRVYHDLSTKEALEKHEQDIIDAEERLKSVKGHYNYENSKDKIKRREAHLDNPSSSVYSTNPFDKPYADTYVDYLNYLTKPDTGKDFRDNKKYYTYGHNDENYYNYDHYKNPIDKDAQSMSPNLVKYKELKNNISSAKDHVRWKTYHDGDYYSSYSSDAMTDEQLEKKIKEMRDKVEAEIEQLKAQNKKNVAGRDEAVKDLEKKEKELDDFLKSKGIRESILSIINSKYLKESVEEDDDNYEYMEIYGGFPDYQALDKIIKGLFLLSKSLERDGIKQYATRMYKVADELKTLAAEIKEHDEEYY